MGKSRWVVLLSLLLIASASPSFAHATKTEMGSGPRTNPAERTAPVGSLESWVTARHLGPKACNYRGGPKTGMWSCERSIDLMSGGSLR